MSAPPSGGAALRDPYATLNVPRNASQTEIRQAYQRMARVTHPDKNPSQHASSANVFGDVEAAWKTIGSAEERRVFDELGHRGVNAMAIVRAQESGSTERLLERVRQQMNDMDEAEELKRLNVSGQVRADASIEHLWANAGALDLLAIQQAVEFPLGGSHSVALAGVAGVRRGEQVLGSISLTHRLLVKRGHVEWTVAATSVGQPSTVNVKIKRAVWPKVRGDFEFVADAEGDAGMSMGVKRHFGLGLVGSMGLGVGLLEGLRVSARHVAAATKNARVLESTLTLSAQNVGVEASWTESLSDKVKAAVTARLMQTALELEVEVSRLLSAFSTGSLAASVGLHGVAIKLRCSRGGLRFEFPLLLTKAPSVRAFMLTSAIPFLAHLAAEQVLKPHGQRWERQARQHAVDELAAARAQARAQMRLMKATAAVRREEEERRSDGLVVLVARFGARLHEAKDWSADSAENIDVTTQLQFFTRDARCVLAGGNLAQLLGFYDPCALEEDVRPRLFVRYRKGGLVYEAFFDCDEPVVELPSARAVLMGEAGVVHA